MDQPRGPILFTAFYVTALLLTFGALLLHERFGATDFKAWAPFFQAVLSAAAIFTAWWLQSVKRAADRREAENDTQRTIKAVTYLAEQDLAHTVAMSMAMPFEKPFSASMAGQLKDTDAIIRRQNLGHLPSTAATVAVLEMMRTVSQFAGALDAAGKGAFAMGGKEEDTEVLMEAYRTFFDARQTFLAACDLPSEDKRRVPDQLTAWVKRPASTKK